MTFIKSILAFNISILLYSFTSPSGDWYKHQDNDCEILFPKVPKTDTISKETSIGKITFYLNILKSGPEEKDSNSVYELVKTAYPSDDLMNPTKEIAESLFRGAVSSSLKQVNGKLLSQKDIKMGDYFGKEFKISFDSDAKLIKMRCYLAKAKAYTIETVSSSNKQNNSNATTFFESFKLK